MRIKSKPTVKYGYGEQFEGTPEQAKAFWKQLEREMYRAPINPKSRRSRSQHVRTTPPRVRSREQTHAPRTTPKAAQRSSGDSGDSDLPAPAALAALLVYLLRGVTL